MKLEHFRSKFEKLSKQRNLSYCLGEKVSEDEIAAIENELQVSFPEQVKLFYQNINGLKVDFPKLEVFAIEKLEFLSKYRLKFAIFNGKHPLFFDTSNLNEANQWNILSEEDFRVTFTMASFWSNKIWAWVERNRSIWKEEFEN